MGVRAESKVLLGRDVLTAARERIAWALDSYERVCVSFSGGKDSTVMLHLACAEARARGRRIGVLIVDLEAQYRLTVEHMLACVREYRNCVDLYWVALPLNLRNAVSAYEPQWLCWDPDKRETWVRQPPRCAITDEGRWDWFRRGMEFEDFVPKFAQWYGAEAGVSASLVGIRTQESLNRWRSIASTSKQTVGGRCWTTAQPGYVNVYPVYDWTTEDIWTYHARHPGRRHNELYDLMHRAGLTIHQQRICQPYGDDQRKGLWLFQVIEPATWGRVVARVNGANQGALYAAERGNVLGQGKVTRPEGHTWQSFAELLLGTMPEATAEHYRVKIRKFLTWWQQRTGREHIPDEADPKLEATKKAPSWRRICKALLRNDYWCKGLSFTQHKNQESYARYRSLLRDQGRHWATARPDGPSERQLKMICALVGSATPAKAWKAVGVTMGCGADRARREATPHDASATIDRLKEEARRESD